MPLFSVRAYNVAMSAVEELPYWVKFETGRDDEQVLTHRALLNILEQERAALESEPGSTPDAGPTKSIR